MFKTIIASTLAAAIALPAASSLAAPPPDCALKEVAAIRPLRDRVPVGGKIVRDRLAGATLYVPAEPGLTTDWLKRIADAHHAEMPAGTAMSMKDCVFGVPGSEIEVSSNNSGFLMVTVRSKDDGAAKEILRRAEATVK